VKPLAWQILAAVLLAAAMGVAGFFGMMAHGAEQRVEALEQRVEELELDALERQLGVEVEPRTTTTRGFGLLEGGE